MQRRGVQRLLLAAALATAAGFDSACASGTEATPGPVDPVVTEVATAPTGASEVTETRIAEERWERVDVMGMADGGSGRQVAAASPEPVPFEAAAANLTPEVRKHLDALALRLSGDSAPRAPCRLDLRPAVPGADAVLVQERAAVVRGYLSREKGIAAESIRVETGVEESPAPSAEQRCVVVALLG